MADGGNAGQLDSVSEQQERILRVAAMVTTAVRDLDLDIIDGEFYWRCARSDLRDQVVALRDQFCLRDQRFPAWEGDLFAFIRDGMDLVHEFGFLQIRASMLYPHHVWGGLLRNTWIAMRKAIAMNVHFHGTDARDDAHYLQLQVFSGAWTGVDVEREVQRSLTRSSLCAGGDPSHPSEDDAAGVQQATTARPSSITAAIRIEFRLVHRRDVAEDGAVEDDELRSRGTLGPYVEVRIPYPPPPPGTVGREYDAVVRDHQRWHLALPGAATRQDQEMAIRTWAVGLLVGTGIRFGSAMRLVSTRCGIPEVTQTRFIQDRKRLLERVPEATPYLFARP